MKVGSKNIIDSRTVIIPQNEAAEFHLEVNEIHLKITIRFNLVPARPPEMGAAMWTSNPESINLIFTTISSTPVIVQGKSPLGTFEDGTSLTFVAEIRRYSSFGIAFIQLMHG